MSYSATISFKHIKSAEIYKFLSALKKGIVEHFDAVAKENFIFAPFTRIGAFEDGKISFNSLNAELRKASQEWAQRCFTYRWFYMPEQELLGIFGLPTCVRDIFMDKTLGFQNSCDQDYEFEYWTGVKYFEEIAEKWRLSSDADVLSHYQASREDDEDSSISLDYYRRTFAYEEIWKHLEDFLFDDASSIYLKFFSYYDDILTIASYLTSCINCYSAWLKEKSL